MKATTIDHTKFISLFRSDNIEKLAIARSILDNAGIESLIRNEHMASILPIGEDMAAELMVHESDAARATKLLNKFLKGE